MTKTPNPAIARQRRLKRFTARISAHMNRIEAAGYHHWRKDAEAEVAAVLDSIGRGVELTALDRADLDADQWILRYLEEGGRLSWSPFGDGPLAGKTINKDGIE